MVRIKYRYFLLRLVFNDKKHGHNIESFEIYKRIKDAVRAVHGDHGIACMDLTLNVKYINVYTNIVLIKVRRQFYRMLWSSIPFVTCISEKNGKGKSPKLPCFLHTLYVGGTIRCCQKFLIKYHRKELKSMLDKCSTPGERRKIKKSIESASLEEEKNRTDMSGEPDDD